MDRLERVKGEGFALGGRDLGERKGGRGRVRRGGRVSGQGVSELALTIR